MSADEYRIYRRFYIKLLAAKIVLFTAMGLLIMQLLFII